MQPTSGLGSVQARLAVREPYTTHGPVALRSTACGPLLGGRSQRARGAQTLLGRTRAHVHLVLSRTRGRTVSIGAPLTQGCVRGVAGLQRSGTSLDGVRAARPQGGMGRHTQWLLIGLEACVGLTSRASPRAAPVAGAMHAGLAAQGGRAHDPLPSGRGGLRGAAGGGSRSAGTMLVFAATVMSTTTSGVGVTAR